MCEEYVDKPLYLLVADWVKAQQRWVSAKEIAKHFNMDHCKAINTVSYILSEVGEIHCETKTIPNELEGRGCQCQRLVRVTHIDAQLYARVGQHAQEKTIPRSPRLSAVPPSELNREQKWQMMLSKSMRQR